MDNKTKYSKLNEVIDFMPEDERKSLEIAFRDACSDNKDEFHCYPIHFSDKSRQEISPEGRHYMSGEYDGVRWHVDLDKENAMWVVTATDGKREYEERLEWVHEPVFGMDVTDADRTEEAILRLVSKHR